MLKRGMKLCFLREAPGKKHSLPLEVYKTAYSTTRIGRLGVKLSSRKAENSEEKRMVSGDTCESLDQTLTKQGLPSRFFK